MSAFPFIEFAAIMLAFGIGAIAPGPDFAMVLRQSIGQGRRAAIATSLGIASAILVHGSYTILGIGLIVSQSLLLFSILKIVGALYLLWLGIGALRAPAPKEPNDLDHAHSGASGFAGNGLAGNGFAGMSLSKAFAIGFLTNLLNPKAVLFFLSLFTSLVSAQTLVAHKAVYVLCMAILLAIWFTFVSFVFTTPMMRTGFYKMGQWFNRATGAALIFLAIRVAVTKAE